MAFAPVTVVHPIGGTHTVDTQDRLESFLASGWALAPARNSGEEPPKKPRKKSKEADRDAGNAGEVNP